MIYEKEKDKALRRIQQADLIFTLDFNNFKRLEGLGPALSESSATKILIDHHQEPDTYPDLYFQNPMWMVA